MRTIEIIELILLAILSIILICVIIIMLRQKVKIKVLRERNDNLQETLELQQKKVTSMERTIPVELYRRLQKNEGEHIQWLPTFRPSIIMDVNTSHFIRHIHSMQANDIFQFINQILVKTIPCVYQKNGIVDNIYKAGFTAYFDEHYEDALTAAISISEIIEKEAAGSDLFNDFSIGMSYGNVLAGLAGTEERISLVIVSEYTGLSSFLQSIAGRYDARILITGTLRNKVDAFEQKFNARKIGYVYISASKTLEAIYDVFDGDFIKKRNNKRKTKIVFEKGVEYYAQGEYQKARQCFIEVFKTNRYDRAAKDYLNRCEQLLTSESTLTINPQIETY